MSERPEEFNDILRYEPSNNKQQNADTLVLDSAKNTYKKVQPLTLKEDSNVVVFLISKIILNILI